MVESHGQSLRLCSERSGFQIYLSRVLSLSIVLEISNCPVGRHELSMLGQVESLRRLPPGQYEIPENNFGVCLP